MNATEKLSNAQIVVLDKEMDRIRQRIRDIKAPYNAYMSVTKDDRDELAGLRARMNEIKGLLGVRF